MFGGVPPPGYSVLAIHLVRLPTASTGLTRLSHQAIHPTLPGMLHVGAAAAGLPRQAVLLLTGRWRTVGGARVPRVSGYCGPYSVRGQSRHGGASSLMLLRLHHSYLWVG